MVSFQISVNYITLCTCMYVYCIVSTCITCSSGLHTIQEGEIISLEHSLGFCTVPCGLSSTPPAGTAGGDGAGLHTPTAPGPDLGPDPDPDPEQGPNQGDSELCMHVQCILYIYTLFTTAYVPIAFPGTTCSRLTYHHILCILSALACCVNTYIYMYIYTLQ